MISKDAQQLASLIRAQFGLHDLLPHMVRQLATAGEPVTVEHAAETGGFTVEQVRAELARHPGVDWDTDGRIAGFGATLRPTPHRFTTDDGRTIYGFCASDALTYPGILNQPGVIESTCPITDQPIRVQVTPDRVMSADPETVVVSRIRPDAAVTDVRAEICDLGNFFASPHAATDWQTHYPHGTLAAIAEDFEVNREAMVELGWTANPTHRPTRKDVAELSQPGGALDLGHDPARVAVRMIRLLAQTGRPVTRDHALDAAAESDVDRATANALLDAWAERNDNGAIVGLGITYNPTPHRMTIDGVQMWTWCGMDTLIFVHLLDKPAAIESTAPGSGEVVRLHADPSGITEFDPVEALATQRVPGRDQVDLSTKNGIWGTFCHHNHFFPNLAEAANWAADRDDIAILSIPDAFATARDIAGALLRYEPKGPQ